MAPTSRFQKLAADAKSRIREISAPEGLEQQKGMLLIPGGKEHAQNAIHLSRGVIELKIEELARDTGAPIICYCGGGSRSALVADNLQRMGYTNVCSLAGGFKAWKEKGLPISTG